MPPVKLLNLQPFSYLSEKLANAAPQLLTGAVDFVAEGSSFGGGRISVSGLRPEDRISIRGSGDNSIGFDGTTVTYAGTGIGTASGGQGNTFTVALSANASEAAVDALIEALTYATPSDTPGRQRTLTISVVDSAGHALASPSFNTAIPYTLANFDVGNWSKPVFVDFNGDGLLDLVSGTFTGMFRAFARSGSDFVELVGSPNPFFGLDVGAVSAPAFIDFSGDGVLDLVSGESQGGLLAYARVGTRYVQVTGSANPFAAIDVGRDSTPAFVDLDGDGRADLVVGEHFTGLHAWRNTTAGFVPFATNPFAGLATGEYAAPAFADLDGDGRVDMVSGNGAGGLTAWRNTAAGFVPFATSPFAAIQVGDNSGPAFADLTGDGRLDLIVGAENGRFITRANATADATRVLLTVAAENDLPVITSAASVGVPSRTTTFAYQAAGHDPEGKALAWSLSGTDAALFTMNPLSGVVTFRAMPDLMAPRDAGRDNRYDIVVQASDGEVSAGRAVVVGVIPIYNSLQGYAASGNAVAESSTRAVDIEILVKRFSSDVTLPLPAASVDWAVAGTGLNPVSAEDFVTAAAVLPSGSITFAAGAANATIRLSLRSDTLIEKTETFVVTFSNALGTRLDFDRTAIISVLDAGGRAPTSGGFSPPPLIFLGPGEQAPIITTAAARSVAENTVGTVVTGSATYPDTTLTYTWSLSGLDAALFAVDAATGAVGFRTAPDFEAPRDDGIDNIYNFYLQLTRPDGSVIAARSMAVTVTDAIEAAALAQLAPAITFAENTVNAAPRLFATGAVFTAGDALAGGHLLVSGLLAEDRATVLTQGNGPGQIGLAGKVVSYGGVDIAIVTGGEGTDLTVTFGGAVTPDAVQALIRRLAFGNASDTPALNRTLSIDVVDGAGHALAAPATTEVVVRPSNEAAGGSLDIVMDDGDLRAVSSLTDSEGMGAISYRWQSQAGGVWADIAGAVGATLTPAAGAVVRVVAAYTDGSGKAEQVSSATIARNGTGGADALGGTGRPDLILGGEGSDTLAGSAGDDTIMGGPGHDVLNGGLGHDWMAGGTGNDTYYLRDAGDVVVEAAGEGLDHVVSAIDWTLDEHVEKLSLSGTADLSGIGNAAANAMAGNAGDNILSGRGGADTLGGGAGADTLIGGEGEDAFLVTRGDDVVFDLGAGGADAVRVSAGASMRASVVNDWTATAATRNAGTASIDAQGHAVNLAAARGGVGWSISNEGHDEAVWLTGSLRADTLRGGHGEDTLTGGLGADRFVIDSGRDTVTDLGRGGPDVVQVALGAEMFAIIGASWTATAASSNEGGAAIYANGFHVDLSATTGSVGWTVLNQSVATAVRLTGSGQDDRLTGGDGGDILLGGDGDDLLLGLEGRDRLSGGAGADVFLYRAAAEGGDVIMDFAAGEDRIMLMADGFGGGLAAGMDPAAGHRFVAGGAATQGFGQFLWDARALALYWDADGTGAASRQVVARFQSDPGLTAADLTIIA